LLLVEVEGGEDIEDIGVEDCSNKEGEKEEEGRGPVLASLYKFP
jgi:hypothetical protein